MPRRAIDRNSCYFNDLVIPSASLVTATTPPESEIPDLPDATGPTFWTSGQQRAMGQFTTLSQRRLYPGRFRRTKLRGDAACAPMVMGNLRLWVAPRSVFSRPSPTLRIDTDSHWMAVDRGGRDPFDLLDEIEQSLALDVTQASWPFGNGRDFLGQDLFDGAILLFELGVHHRVVGRCTAMASMTRNCHGSCRNRHSPISRGGRSRTRSCPRSRARRRFRPQ
jgi:hypothetical protein